MATKKHAPLVSIVILNWNGIDDTKTCLRSVGQLTYGNIEVIVVDNGSSKAEKEYLTSLDGIIFVDNPQNKGFTGGHNDGYKFAQGEFILLLNNDTVIDSKYIEKALPLFDDASVAAVGGRAYFFNNHELAYDTSNRFYSYMTLDIKSGETTLKTEDAGMIQEVNAVSGASFMVRKSIINKVGYLHDEFFAYYEETDLIARMKRSGYRILYNPELHIWHKNGASSGAQSGSKFFYYHIFRNRYLFATRNFEQPFLRSFRQHYFLFGIRSLIQGVLGRQNRVLGLSYTKAMLYVIYHSLSLRKQRNKLVRIHGNSHYCEQITKEQLSFTYIHTSNTKIVVKDDNPQHEYITITKNPKISERLIGNKRSVIDRGYFSAEPLTFGCIVARMPWLIIAITPQKNADPNMITDQLYEAERARKKVIILSSDGTLFAIKKDYFQFIGGFEQGGNGLSENVCRIISLASLDKSLLLRLDGTTLIPKEETQLSLRLTYYRHLLKSRQPNRWEIFLEHHYRLFQLRNLFEWLFSLRVPLRLKLGRLRNLMKFSIKMRKGLIADELRIINHERLLFNKKKMLQGPSLLHDNASLDKTINHAKVNPKNIPIFILCYQRLSHLKELVGWLEVHGHNKIIFIDNNSTYQPLLDYYTTSPYQKLFLYKNIGHTAPWTLDIVRTLVPNDFYVVSDPDVVPSPECPDNVISHLVKLHEIYRDRVKIGLGLLIDDIPDHYPLAESVKQWEKQFWKVRLEDGLFDAGVDTTFALYKPHTYNYSLHPSARTDLPYVARHLPWYIDPRKPSAEEAYYRANADRSITSWNVDELPERYLKELRK